MKRIIAWFFFITGALLLFSVVFVLIMAPRRERNQARTYERFRAEFQASHDAIDAGFKHRDRVVKGIRWHYVDEGSPNGAVILFLHGLPEGWYSWRYVIPLVDHRYRIIAIDMKGYGRSDTTDGNYDWHTVAAQIVDLMDDLGIQRFHVVGHDWGAIIGSVLVNDHQRRISGYVRMEADLVQRKGLSRLAAFIQKPQWILFQNRWIASFLMRDPGWFIDRVYPGRMTTPFRKIDRDYLVYEFSRPGVADVVPRYFSLGNWDLDAAIGAVCRNNYPFPVLQLQADTDPAQPPSIFADTSTRCPHVRMEWVRGASHFDNFDQPALVAEAINHFVHAIDKGSVK